MKIVIIGGVAAGTKAAAKSSVLHKLFVNSEILF